ncbi:MAG: hypothetical protein E7624_01585 [Ruminococcaceae bacterium]|nr:hypothetical protein [Oscillospiraceae bacterium]
MNKLPKGYYAVQGLEDDVTELVASSFTYKGVEYAVEVGVNIFPTVAAALAAATETPDTVLEGLNYEKFEAPVILLAAGKHGIGRKGPKDRVIFDRSIYLLGQQAGVNPNLPFEDPMQPQPLNPARGNEETESNLRGGYDFGCAYASAPNISVLVIDGVVTTKSWRFGEWRSAPGCDIKVEFKNIIHHSPDGHTLYSFSAIRGDNAFQRNVLLENIRLDKDFFDCGYGGMLFAFNGEKFTVDNLCVDGTTQIFGFSNIPRTSNCTAMNRDETTITFKNSFIRNLRGENGICLPCNGVGERAVKLNFENTTIINGSRENEAAFQIDLFNDRSGLALKNCRVIDERGNQGPAVEIRGSGKNVTLENTTLEGYTAECGPAPIPPSKAPEKIENKKIAWTTKTADAHRVVGTNKADFSAMDAYYEGCTPYYGDLHTHSNSGGTSDGHTPIEDWVGKMDELGLDFAVMVDHRQMRGYFLPAWNEERFVYGTEPGTHITDLYDPNASMSTLHYNMVFPHKYALAMVLANFPEFKFQGDELTGKFGYPKFTKERMAELNAYIYSLGGYVSHPHPKVLMASADPLDYYLGEWSHLETFVGGYASHASYKSYDLWVEILNKGKHMYTSAGSDTHSAVNVNCLSTFYTQKRFHSDFIKRLHAGDFACGGIGVKMMIDGNPMGSQIEYKDGMKLTLRVDNFHKSVWRADTAYELQVWTDEGLAYSSMFNGKEPQELSLEVQKRRYYRVVIEDLTHKYRVCISNPIWLDKEPAAEAEA